MSIGKYRVLNGLTLKIAALVSMVIDHIGYILFPDFTILRIIGRIAFPIYAFLAAEGAQKTGNIEKYILRLFAFALISECIFDLGFNRVFFYAGYQNIFFTLGLGVAAIWFTDSPPEFAAEIPRYIRGISGFALASVAAELLKTDYGVYGVMTIFLFYFLRDRLLLALIGTELIFICMGKIQLWGFMGLIPLLFYSGERGYRGKALQYSFYAAYPLHLLLLHFLDT